MKKYIIWTAENCPRCDETKQILNKNNISFETRNIDKLVDGYREDDLDMKAMAQLAWQNMAVPVILRIKDKVFIEDLKKEMENENK